MKSQFIGTWRLVSWELRSTKGEPFYPLGKDAVGQLMYSADGYMAVVLSKPGRAPFKSPWLMEGTTPEKTDAMDSYSSYAGRYEVREQEGKVIHFVELSLFPNWIGTAQERFFKLEGDRLELSAALPLKDGIEQTVALVWQKTG